MTSPINTGLKEYIFKQTEAGARTMFPTFGQGEPNMGSNPYVTLGKGVFQVILHWSGKPQVVLVHQMDGVTQQDYLAFESQDSWNPRRWSVILSSENTNNRFYLRSNGLLDPLQRCSVQVIPSAGMLVSAVSSSIS